MQTIFTVSDLACSACVETIERAIHSIDPQAQIVADPQTKLVQIESELSTETLSAAIVNAGYSVSS